MYIVTYSSTPRHRPDRNMDIVHQKMNQKILSNHIISKNQTGTYPKAPQKQNENEQR